MERVNFLITVVGGPEAALVNVTVLDLPVPGA